MLFDGPRGSLGTMDGSDRLHKSFASGGKLPARSGGRSLLRTTLLCHRRTSIRNASLFVLFALTCCGISSDARAEHFEESFESPKASWILTSQAPRHLLIEHHRQAKEAYRGQSAEYFYFDSPGRENAFGLIHELPPTPVFDELTASIWVKSNRPGLRVAVRIRCPRAIDPTTGKGVVFNLFGDDYRSTNEWQELKCVTTDDEVRRRLMRLRAELIADGARPDIDLSELRVESIELQLGLVPGPTLLLIDDLQFGPLVSFGAATPGTPDEFVERGRGPLDLSGGHIRVKDRPFVPRMVPYHGEPTDLLAKLGLNVVWLDDPDQSELTAALRSANIWVASVPPSQKQTVGIRPTRDWGNSLTKTQTKLVSAVEPDSNRFDSAEWDDSLNSAPTPMGQRTDSVLYWMLGTRIDSAELGTVESITEAVRQSDRLYDRPRPVMADVVGDERRFSRRLDSTGSTVPTIHTSRSPRDYYGELLRRRRLTLAGSPKTTWVATEPSPAVSAALGPKDRPAIVEPEQIMMQAELALAAGYKGINFWTRSSLAGDAPGDDERRAAIELVNRRIALLQPWIATGEFISLANVMVGDDPMAGQADHRVIAAVFQSDYGILVRCVWLDDEGQLVPGSMAARNIRAVVKAGETPRAYVVTTTGVKSIDAEVIAGGTQIHLPMLDQSATILITSYDPLVEDVRRQVLDQSADAADAWVRMANAKLERVRETHDRLQAVSRRPLRSAASLLAEARMHANRADDALASEEYDSARLHSLWSMHLLRRLQTEHWQSATRELDTPQSSVHAVCFETLPDYWRDRSRIDATLPSSVRVPGGDFSDQEQMTEAGWIPRLPDDQELAGAVSTAPSSSPDGQSLLLAAADVEGSDPSAVRIAIDTPIIDAQPGELVELTARIRALDKHKPGIVRLSDSRIGPVLGAQKLAPMGMWESISVVRSVSSDQPIRFRFELLGSGAAFIDDVSMRVVPAEGDQPTELAIAAPPEKPKRRPLILTNPLEFLPSLPNFATPSFPSWRREERTEPVPSEVAEEPSTSDLTDDGEPLVLPTIRPGHGLLPEAAD